MGHLAGKDFYKSLGDKIDNLHVRVNKNAILYNILKELYSPDEAEVVVRMPYRLSPADKIEKATGIERSRLNPLLETLCKKGLVIDAWLGDRYFYVPSPMFIGIFEFTMMRTDKDADLKKLAKLFNEYMTDERIIEVNFGNGQQVSPLRTMPHEGTILETAYTEVLEYERITPIVESNKNFAIGLCSCRHEKLHAGEKKCDNPLETCISFGGPVDYMVRHNFARIASKGEVIMLLGVMGIIFFSVSETSVLKNQKFNAIILFALSIITIIIDLIALSAIFYRLVSKFLPVYLIWIFIVVFSFPFIFGMK